MSKVYKAQLSSYDAANCQAARKPKCRCRCGGLLHGISHVDFMDQIRDILDDKGELTEEEALAMAARIAATYQPKKGRKA